MANETILTVVGNLTADPELRFTPNGAAVANFTIASTPRTFDRQANEWKDGETLFLRASIWREAAENVAETLTKGMRVIAQGRLKARSYEDRDGNKRTSYELDVDEIGPSIKHATAKVTRSQRGQGQGQGQGGGYGFGGGQQGGGFGGAPAGGGYGGGQQGGGWDQGQAGPPQGAQGGHGGPQGGGFPGPGAQGGQGGGQAPQDPWAGAGGWDTPSSGEPPF